MPRRFKRTGRRIKRRHGRSKRHSKFNRKSKGRPSTAVMRGPNGFPDRVKVKLNYSDTLIWTITSGVAVFDQFRGNSLFDPDQTGTGHQPYAFDQWSAFYSKYRVYGSAIRAQWLTNTTASVPAYNQWLVVVPQTGANTTTYTSPLNELPYCSYRISNSYQQNNKFNMIKKYMSTAKIFGELPATVKADPNYEALTSANPTNTWNWTLVGGTVDQTTSSGMDVMIKITYYVEFSDRQTLSAS